MAVGSKFALPNARGDDGAGRDHLEPPAVLAKRAAREKAQQFSEPDARGEGGAERVYLQRHHQCLR